jgi:hypothetical protein
MMMVVVMMVVTMQVTRWDYAVIAVMVMMVVVVVLRDLFAALRLCCGDPRVIYLQRIQCVRNRSGGCQCGAIRYSVDSASTWQLHHTPTSRPRHTRVAAHVDEWLSSNYDDAFRHSRDCRQAKPLADQTSLAKELPFSVQGNDCFLARFGYDVDLDLALLNVKDGIRPVALREDFLILAIGVYGPPAVRPAEEGIHVERLFFLFRPSHERLASGSGEEPILMRWTRNSTFSVERQLGGGVQS